MTAETQKQCSVLVAEDDRVMSDVIRFNLERRGYQVVVARDGLEAWGLLQTRHFDILVSDYQMPGMSGEELCRTLRATYPDRHLPVIFLSARGLELDATRLKDELQIDMLMFKPFSPRELLAAVADCLQPVIASAE